MHLLRHAVFGRLQQQVQRDGVELQAGPLVPLFGKAGDALPHGFVHFARAALPTQALGPVNGLQGGGHEVQIAAVLDLQAAKPAQLQLLLLVVHRLHGGLQAGKVF